MQVYVDHPAKGTLKERLEREKENQEYVVPCKPRKERSTMDNVFNGDKCCGEYKYCKTRTMSSGFRRKDS